jgi:hypothetical protein
MVKTWLPGMLAGYVKARPAARLAGERPWSMIPSMIPEKTCPARDPGSEPVFGRDHAEKEKLDHDPIRIVI